MPLAKSVVSNADSLCFSLNSTNSELVDISHSEIKEVHVFKRDMFGYDLICMNIISAANTETEIDEECHGWKALITTLEQSLRGFPKIEEWWSDVAFPAFETNHKVLYSK